MKPLRPLLTGLLGLAALVLAPPLATPLAAQTAIDPPAGPWTHRGTGTQFPETVGDYQRGGITEYDDTGDDASVSYTRRIGDHALVVTLYVYPQYPDTTCDDEFAGVEQAIDKYPGSQRIAEGKTLPPAGRGGLTARTARYLIPAGAMKEGIPALVSDAYLYCTSDGQWLVKYRASWNGDAGSFPDVAPFLHAFAWNRSLGGAD